MSVTKPVIAQYFFIKDEGLCIWDKKFSSNIPYDKLTRLYIAFAWLKDGKLTYENTTNKPIDADRISALVKACRAANPSAEIYISSGFEPNSGSMYLKAAENPDGFAQSVVDFLRHHKLDGYDMDWENGLQKEGLNNLLTATRKALDAASQEDGKTYGLTLATWPYVHPEYDLPTIAQTVDAINIMSYGSHRNLSPIVEQFRIGGFPVSKMIGGIETEKDYPEGGVDTLRSDGTIAEKAAFARNNGLAGMMAWRLDNDYLDNGLSTYKGAEQLAESMIQ